MFVSRTLGTPCAKLQVRSKSFFEALYFLKRQPSWQKLSFLGLRLQPERHGAEFRPLPDPRPTTQSFVAGQEVKNLQCHFGAKDDRKPQKPVVLTPSGKCGTQPIDRPWQSRSGTPCWIEPGPVESSESGRYVGLYGGPSGWSTDLLTR